MAEIAPPLRIVFLGSDGIALPMLEEVCARGAGLATFVGVFTQPDRPHGRGQRVEAGAVKKWAVAHGLPVHQPAVFDDAARAALAALRPDLSVVFAYGHILRQPVIDTPAHGIWNLHASLLPKYRGASPIQTAVACGEAETGVSLMRLVRALDAGPVAAVRRLGIDPLDTAQAVEARLAELCGPLLMEGLERLRSGTLQWVEQDAAAATYCRRLHKEDGVLDFRQPARVLAARVNGLYPWPTCGVAINGVPVKLGEAEAVSGAHPGSPGEVLGADAEGLLVAAGEGALRLRRLQRPGGRMLPATEFLRGFPVEEGTLLPSQAMPSLLVERRV